MSRPDITDITDISPPHTVRTPAAALPHALAGRTVLVTGGCGFIGHWLVHDLAAAGAAVRVLDDLSTGESAALPTGAELYRGSVLDRTVVAKATRGADLVLHLAGVVGMRLALQRARFAHRVATEGTECVLAATPAGAPVVLFSSSAVYGLNEGAASLCESESVDRSRVLAYDGGEPGYATGKWEMERLAERAAVERPVLVVRPFNVVGGGQSSRYGMVLPTFVERALAGLPLVVHGDGTQRRSFGDLATFAATLWRLVANDRAFGPEGRPVNIGAPSSHAILDLAQLVLEVTGSDEKIEHIPYASAYPGQRDTRDRAPDPTRLTALAGPVAWPDLRDIVEACVADVRANQEHGNT